MAAPCVVIVGIPIAGAAVSALFIWGFTGGIDREKWTQQMESDCRKQYPNHNILVVNNKHDHFKDLHGVIHHSHVEIKANNFGATHGFDIYVFEEGEFTLKGDGGYMNWCFSGNCTRNGPHVSFKKFPQSQPQPQPIPISVAKPIPTPVIQPVPCEFKIDKNHIYRNGQIWKWGKVVVSASLLKKAKEMMEAKKMLCE